MSEIVAFIVMPFREPFELLYEKSILPSLKSLGFKAIRADEITTSTSFLNDIEKGIREADIVIVEASSENQNVYFEFGLAKALNKEFILLASKDCQLPSDTSHIRHLIYDYNDVEKLESKLLEWLKETKAYKVKVKAPVSKLLSRGEIFGDICDASIYLEEHPKDPKSEIIASIKAGRLIHPKYIYLFNRGTQLWLELCSDAEYSFFTSSVRFLQNNVCHILDSIQIGGLNQTVDIISLGSGNGTKDRIIINALLQRQKQNTEQICYYPFDISASMIMSAVRNISGQKDIRHKLKIKAAIADFGSDLHSFSPMYQFHQRPNIFLLLGNSLGNFENETAVLQQIKKAMFVDDYLLLEVRVANSEHVDLGGSEALNRRFDFVPLDALGVEYNDEKFKYQIVYDRSNVSNTKTVVATYNNPIIPGIKEQFEQVQLSYIHEYSPADLTRMIKRLGFEVIERYPNEGFIYFLLKKCSKLYGI